MDNVDVGRSPYRSLTPESTSSFQLSSLAFVGAVLLLARQVHVEFSYIRVSPATGIKLSICLLWRWIIKGEKGEECFSKHPSL